ncbi:E3 ubiquitin-protein ligase RNF4-like isoform X2 [Clavelina lepadiformis]|uniref:E3 ubiquitin-protein ligase RNF4-like isoform X2 n=1 Tax=Clavelina lepadiformis TaxID=159417 RepID=UPI004042B5BA
MSSYEILKTAEEALLEIWQSDEYASDAETSDSEAVDLTCNDSVELVDLTTPASLIRPPLNRTQKRTDAAGLITTTSAPRQDLLSHEDTSPILKLNCPVCLEPLHSVIRAGRKICSTVCGHIFCRSCIKQAVRTCKKCPTCRKKLTEKGFHDIFLPIS